MKSKRRITRRPPARLFDPEEHSDLIFDIIHDLDALVPGIFGSSQPEPNAEDLGEIVLKVTGNMAFTPTDFARLDMQPLAGDEHKHFFVLTNQESRALFRELAEKYSGDPSEWNNPASWRDMLENVQDITLYGPNDRVDSSVPVPEGDGVVTIDIALWPTSVVTQGAEKVGADRVAALRAFIAEADPQDSRVEVTSWDSRDPDTLRVRATVNARVFALLADHAYVERIHGPLQASVGLQDIFAGQAPTNVPLPEGAPIGIIDDLVVGTNPWLKDVVVEQRDFPSEHVFGAPTRHGTQVAGLAAWGDVGELLADPDFDGQPFPLYLARVAQMNDKGKAQIVDTPALQLEAALDWLHGKGVRIVVFALGETHADNGAIPSDLSSTLDKKASELGIVNRPRFSAALKWWTTPW